MTEPPVSQVGRTVVLTGDALLMTYYAYAALAQRRRRNGLEPGPLLLEAARVTYRAMSSQRHKDDDPAPTEGSCDGQHGDLIDSAAAARLLGIGLRQAQRLAPTIGIRRGSIWLYDRDAVLALADKRKASA